MGQRETDKDLTGKDLTGKESLKKSVLITGGTGFVGKAVLARLVEGDAYERIYLLVRPSDRSTAAERVAAIVGKMFPPGRVGSLTGRIQAVAGDLTRKGLGIGGGDLELLRRDVNQILHVGASTDFGAPLDESRLSNVEGTRHALELAEELGKTGILERFDYVSTAYVAGRKAGVVGEGDLIRGQEFSNNYEQSKYEAELLVREYMQRIPIAIYRPSIVVGDSNSGHTPHFKVLYWPLLLLSKNLLPFFACNQEAHLDVVPVDFVADGIVALMQQDSSIGETFHLTAGLNNEIRIRNILRDSYKFAQINKRPIIPCWTFNLIKATPLARLFSQSFWDAVDMAQPYSHYLKGTGVRFDSSKTAKALQAHGLTAPAWDGYKREVLAYCRASRWGKRLPMPEYIYYLPVSSRKQAAGQATVQPLKALSQPHKPRLLINAEARPAEA
jgi:thioester reductase-like protein